MARACDMRLVATLVLVISFSQSGWSNPVAASRPVDGTRSISCENEQYSVSVPILVDATTGQPPLEAMDFTIKSKKTGSAERVSIKYRYRSIERIEPLFDDKFMAIGELSRAGNFAAILNAGDRKVEFVIRNYGHSLSPSRKLLAYATWCPPYGLPESRGPILMICDLSRPDVDNLDPRIARDAYAVGYPIFPEVNVREKSTNILVGDDRYEFVSPFLWRKDETKVVFIVFKQAEEENYLVVVDITTGIESPKISMKHIRIEDVAKPDLPVDTILKRLLTSESRFVFIVAEMEWQGDKEISVKTSDDFRWFLPESLTLAIPMAEQEIDTGE